MTKRYLVVDGEVLGETSNGQRTTYIPDPSGNVIALQNDAGEITETFDYWPYGEPTQGTPPSAPSFRFAGMFGYYHDTDTRTYVRARHYQPHLGRWMTVDPRWPAEDSYRYVKSNPVTKVDPMGLQELPPNQYEEILGVAVGYGNYCGARAPLKWCKERGRTPPRPVDCLDACCRNHDWAWWQCNCGLGRGLSPECIRSNQRICECAHNVDCNKHVLPENREKCRKMKKSINAAFCSAGWPTNWSPGRITFPPIEGGPTPQYPPDGDCPGP